MLKDEEDIEGLIQKRYPGRGYQILHTRKLRKETHSHFHNLDSAYRAEIAIERILQIKYVVEGGVFI